MSHSPLSNKGSKQAYEAGWRKVIQSVNSGGSWSGHERNCCYLNTGAARFADVSAVAGLDFPDDGRCVAPADWDLDGDLDLWLSARTSPRLRFMRNDTRHGADAEKHFLAVRLVGSTCNKDAIGARVELRVAGRKLVRSQRAGDGYLSQGSKWIHFGLADSTDIESLIVRWPGGEVESFDGARANERYTLVQSSGEVRPWEAPSREVALQPSRLETKLDADPQRMVLHDRIPLPQFTWTDFADQQIAFPSDVSEGPTLINLWATWCAPCMKELAEIKSAEDKIRSTGLNVVALSVDGLGEAPSTSTADAKQLMRKLQFPFATGAADQKLLDKLDVFQEVFTSLRTQRGQLPSSFLIDEFGRLAVIYTGPVSVAQLLADVQSLKTPSTESHGGAFPFAGRWFARPHKTGEILLAFAEEFYERGNRADALKFAKLAADLATRDGIPREDAQDLAMIFFIEGEVSLKQGGLDEARRCYRQALTLRPNWAEAHTNLGNVYRQLKAFDEAEDHFRIAMTLKPRLIQPAFSLGLIRLDQERLPQAVGCFARTVELDSQFAPGHGYLGVALARLGRTQEAVHHLRAATQMGDAAAQRNLQLLLSGQVP